jgi:hypothetical protein
MGAANALAYYNSATITAVKSFTVQALLIAQNCESLLQASYGHSSEGPVDMRVPQAAEHILLKFELGYSFERY